MLDVVFIMLIFFIVTASFLREFGVDGTKPPSVQQTQTDSKSIAIRIQSNGEILIDGLSVDLRAVSAQITRRKAENPEATLLRSWPVNAPRRSWLSASSTPLVMPALPVIRFPISELAE